MTRLNPLSTSSSTIATTTPGRRSRGSPCASGRCTKRVTLTPRPLQPTRTDQPNQLAAADPPHALWLRLVIAVSSQCCLLGGGPLSGAVRPTRTELEWAESSRPAPERLRPRGGSPTPRPPLPNTTPPITPPLPARSRTPPHTRAAL